MHGEHLDVDLGVSGLLAGSFGAKAYMDRRRAAWAGAVRSAAKAAAAWRNGAKGGHPRKPAAVERRNCSRFSQALARRRMSGAAARSGTDLDALDRRKPQKEEVGLGSFRECVACNVAKKPHRSEIAKARPNAPIWPPPSPNCLLGIGRRRGLRNMSSSCCAQSIFHHVLVAYRRAAVALIAAGLGACS